MSNGKRLPVGYGLYRKLQESRGVKAYLTPHAFRTVGSLRAFEDLLPRKRKGVVHGIRSKKRRTGGISGLF